MATTDFLNGTGLGYLISKIKAAFVAKADTATVTAVDIDSAPTANSTNLVTSGGVYTALADKADSSDVTGKADKVSNPTSGNFAALDSNGNLTDSGHKHSDYLTSHQDITGKADKVSSATNGHLAGLDSNGNLTDSGKSASDFQPTIDSSHKLPYSLISDTPTIPTVTSMAAADISTAVDTAWNAVMS